MLCAPQAAKAYFLEVLQVRYSSPLFRLPTSDHIKRQVTFHNTGPQQVLCNAQQSFATEASANTSH